MCNFLKTMFTKKQPKEWSFGPKPVVNWQATNKVKYDMTTICKLILTQILNIQDIELTVATNDSQVKMFDTPDFELHAMLIGYPNLKKYSLILRSNIGAASILSVVCHEMVHLDQYNRGDLELKGKTFKWKGKEYTGEVPYFQRPWEIEATKKQKEIENKVKKLYF